jgi:hypothetical protein
VISLFFQALLELSTLVGSTGMEMEKKESYADWQRHLIGTTFVMIATDAFDRYQKATGSVYDQDTEMLKITSAQYANLKSIFVHIKGVCVSNFIMGRSLAVWSSDISSFFARFHSN